MRDIEELFPYIKPYVATCPDPTILMHVRNAAKKFLEKTRTWREVVTLDLNKDPEDLLVCRDGQLFEIEIAKWKEAADHDFNKPLEAESYIDIKKKHDYVGIPQWVYQPTRGTVSVFPFQVGILELSVYVRPDNRATTLPDFIFEEYPQTIANGALASLLLLPGQPYTNSELGVYFKNEFGKECDSLFNQNTRGQQRASGRTKPSFF